ncbi:hypothetical protein J5N97_022716 [Dioscorea zingiberensis]|uniref:PGG domain-containing protein n=1 Tax=Dioscorea zingiberensis TaxID=325984 RepID=A0A9D5CBA1_9LILI|nr:hypothetical protein J5N97_022716 [Dioscorea zingiberensis]
MAVVVGDVNGDSKRGRARERGCCLEEASAAGSCTELGWALMAGGFGPWRTAKDWWAAGERLWTWADSGGLAGARAGGFAGRRRRVEEQRGLQIWGVAAIFGLGGRRLKVAIFREAVYIVLGIPLKNNTDPIAGKEHEGNNRDVEKQGQSSPYNNSVEDETDSEEVLHTKSNRKLATYLSNRVKDLEELKNNHAQNLKLVAYLAKDPTYWDFMNYKGMYNRKNDKVSELEDDEDELYFGDMNEEVVDDESDDYLNRRDLSTFSPENKKEEMGQQEFLKQMMKNIMVEFGKHITDKKAKGPTRWRESPLLVGAKMGLYDFVEQILKVCPESAQYKDIEGKNVLQVAIKHGHEKTVKIIIGMTTRSNPMLPSSLLSAQDKDNNTILHYAAETTIGDEGPPMQMFYEIKWFERVEKIVPKDILYSRNSQEKTGQELFTEKHKDMLKSGRQQLMELGKTYAGLMVAAVFALGFSILGEDDNPDGEFINLVALKGTRLSTSSSDQIFTSNDVLYIGCGCSTGVVRM